MHICTVNDNREKIRKLTFFHGYKIVGVIESTSYLDSLEGEETLRGRCEVAQGNFTRGCV